MVYSLDINVYVYNKSLQNICLFELSIWVNLEVRLNQLHFSCTRFFGGQLLFKVPSRGTNGINITPIQLDPSEIGVRGVRMASAGSQFQLSVEAVRNPRVPQSPRVHSAQRFHIFRGFNDTYNCSLFFNLPKNAKRMNILYLIKANRIGF